MSTLVENQLDHLAETEREAANEFAKRLREQLDETVDAIVMFGSRARGEAAPDSDMDMLVLLPHASSGARRAVRYLAVEVWLKYGIYLSTRVSGAILALAQARASTDRSTALALADAYMLGGHGLENGVGISPAA